MIYKTQQMDVLQLKHNDLEASNMLHVYYNSKKNKLPFVPRTKHVDTTFKNLKHITEKYEKTKLL